MDAALTARRERWGFGLLVALLVLAAGAKAVLYDTLDPDLFWHLRVADTLSRQSFPRAIVDDLSFASLKTPWTPYSWLADLAIKRLWDWGGYRTAIAAQALMTAGIAWLLALSALEMTIAAFGRPRYLAVALAGLAGEFLCLPYLSLRPVTAALLILGIIAWLIRRDQRLREKSRAVWAVIPLAALLANVHLYVVFAPLAVLARFGTTGLEWKGAKHSKHSRAIFLFVATLAASFMTPMLRGAIATAWHYQFADVMVRGHVIAEMQPFYEGQLGWAAGAIVLFVLGCAIYNRRLLRREQWFWLAGSLVALLRMGRFSPVFAIFAAPTLAVTLPRLSDAALGRVATRAVLAALLLVGGLRVAYEFPGGNMPLSGWLNRLGPGTQGYPTAATDFVQWGVPPQTHQLISEFTWGGYLEWRLGSRYQVLMDGRTQLYSSSFWRALYLGTPAERRAYLLNVHADAAVLPVKGSAFGDDLMGMGWKVAYRDERAEVLVPPAKVDAAPVAVDAGD